MRPMLSKRLRAHQGSPEITAWCGRCRERVVPMSDGRCGWCDFPVAGESLARRQRQERARLDRERAERTRRERVARRAEERHRESQRGRIASFIEEKGPATTSDMMETFGLSRTQATKIVYDLRRAGELKEIARIKKRRRGSPLFVYDLERTA